MLRILRHISYNRCLRDYGPAGSGSPEFLALVATRLCGRARPSDGTFGQVPESSPQRRTSRIAGCHIRL